MKNPKSIIGGLIFVTVAFAVVLASPRVLNAPLAYAGPQPTAITACGIYDAGNYVLANNIDGVPQNQVCITFSGKKTSHSATTFNMNGNHIYCSPPGTGINGVSLQG